MSLTFFCSFLLLQLVSWSSLDCSVEASTSLRGKHDENDLTDTFSLSKNTSPRSLADETASVTTDLEPSTRIVNGQNAPQGRFPWFVRTLGTDAVGGIGACGGALIAPDMVLSAAHCE
jgi:Trypsin